MAGIYQPHVRGKKGEPKNSVLMSEEKRLNRFSAAVNKILGEVSQDILKKFVEAEDGYKGVLQPSQLYKRRNIRNNQRRKKLEPRQ